MERWRDAELIRVCVVAKSMVEVDSVTGEGGLRDRQDRAPDFVGIGIGTVEHRRVEDILNVVLNGWVDGREGGHKICVVVRIVCDERTREEQALIGIVAYHDTHIFIV